MHLERAYALLDSMIFENEISLGKELCVEVQRPTIKKSSSFDGLT